MRKSNKKWVFLWVFSINFYGFSASGYVMTTLDELITIPPGEFLDKISKNQETSQGVFLLAILKKFFLENQPGLGYVRLHIKN